MRNPPISYCETHVGPSAPRCVNCVPGLFVCPDHLVVCGGQSFLCCPFCFKVQCFKHIYCECDGAVARRRWCAPRIAADDAAAAARRADIAALWAEDARHRAMSASRRLEFAVRSSCGFHAVPAPAPLAIVEEVADTFDDWPISDTCRDFAFAPVVFRALTVDIEPYPAMDIAL